MINCATPVALFQNLRKFYQTFPKRYAVRSELTWTHEAVLLNVSNSERSVFRIDMLIFIATVYSRINLLTKFYPKKN